MTTDDRKQEATSDSNQKERRPYLKPAFKHERVFETMALQCGKVGGTLPQCGSVPAAS